jgi:hypothetical protein
VGSSTIGATLEAARPSAGRWYPPTTGAAAGEAIQVMAKSFQYRGNLAETTLPEMLYTIDRFRVPGVIWASHGEGERVVKRVFIRGGYVVHASSTDRNDSLGVYLRRTGRITLEQFERLTRAREDTTKRFGTLLVEEKLLSPQEVFAAIREQIEGIVWSLFYWDEGEVTYGAADSQQEDMVQIQLSLREVIFEGIKRAPDARTLLARLGGRETLLEPCFRAEELIEVGLDGSEYGFLTQVDGKTSLYDLCSSGPQSPGDNAKLLYAFTVLHLTRTVGRAAGGAGPVKIRLESSGDRAG